MENAPVILIGAFRLPPDIRERYRMWVAGAYWPMLMKVPWLKAIDSHRIIKENSEYNASMTFFYFDSLNHLENFQTSAEYIAWAKDIEASWARYGEVVWWAAYKLLERFVASPSAEAGDKVKSSEDVIVRHIEAPRLSPVEEERYDNWFARWGYDVYIPLLMKLPGLKEYARFKLADLDLTDFEKLTSVKIPTSHPLYMSILTFENIKAFENYKNSLELAAFRSAMDIYFPKGLEFKWYVQYNLTISQRK